MNSDRILPTAVVLFVGFQFVASLIDGVTGGTMDATSRFNLIVIQQRALDLPLLDTITFPMIDLFETIRRIVGFLTWDLPFLTDTPLEILRWPLSVVSFLFGLQVLRLFIRLIAAIGNWIPFT